MLAQGGAGGPEFLSTHPAEETRINDLRRAAEELKKTKR
jgi:predicted Zn-dependent protease